MRPRRTSERGSRKLGPRNEDYSAAIISSYSIEERLASVSIRTRSTEFRKQDSLVSFNETTDDEYTRSELSRRKLG